MHCFNFIREKESFSEFAWVTNIYFLRAFFSDRRGNEDEVAVVSSRLSTGEANFLNYLLRLILLANIL